MLPTISNVQLNSEDGSTKSLEINDQTFIMTRICLVISIISTFAHLVVIALFKRIQILYGMSLVATFLVSMIGYCLQLTTCVNQFGSTSFVILRHFTNFTIIVTIALNFLTIFFVLFSFLNVHAREPGKWFINPMINMVHKFQDFGIIHNWFHNSLILITIVLLVIFLPGLFSVLSFNQEQNIDHSIEKILQDHNTTNKNFSNISCNLTPTRQTIEWFFGPVLCLLFLQTLFCLMCMRLTHEDPPEQRILATMNEKSLAARYMIASKICFTNSIVWMIAFVCIQYQLVQVWHFYVLATSLQTIFITINCIFSRPVLDHIIQWKEERQAFDLRLFHLNLRRSCNQYRSNSGIFLNTNDENINDKMLHKETVYSFNECEERADDKEDTNYSSSSLEHTTVQIKSVVYQTGLV